MIFSFFQADTLYPKAGSWCLHLHSRTGAAEAAAAGGEGGAAGAGGGAGGDVLRGGGAEVRRVPGGLH